LRLRARVRRAGCLTAAGIDIGRGVKNAERRAFAPARVNLMGEHTDYSGGLVLPVAVDVGTTVSWRPLDGVVRARSATFDSTVEVDTNEPSHDVSGWGRYVAALVDLLRERGRPAYGMDALVESTAPMGAGLSSSAALPVSFGLSLCSAASFELPPIELAHVAREAEARLHDHQGQLLERPRSSGADAANRHGHRFADLPVAQ